jgi:hypothetical protein
MQALGEPVSLWDVRNVEAHVRGALDAGLASKGARLNAQQYDRALQFLREKCWHLSGLQADGKTLRYVWIVVGAISPRGALEPYKPLGLPESGSPASAQQLLDTTAADLLVEGRSIAFATIKKVRPRGAYDPSRGISFSTYSWRLLSNARISDWYRSDEEFGDTRYESNRRREESLEALSHRLTIEGDHVDDLPAPIGRLDVVDELNRHAYRDVTEEVLPLEAFGIRG